MDRNLLLIIESESQLQEFLKIYKTEDCILVPIQCDTNKHPANDKLSLLYVKVLTGDEFVVPLNHSETLNIDVPDLKSDSIKYTYDSKKLKHLIELDNVVDVNLLHYMNTGYPLEIDNITTNAHNYFNINHYRKPDVNNIIPVMKHLEYCREVSKLLENTIQNNTQSVNTSYNDEIFSNLTYIESNGLKTLDGMKYSEYNLYTSTGRPSNRFGGTNFAALNKKDGSRKEFVSRFDNGVLVEMDFDAYHLRLIADKIGYEFPQGSVHNHMAKLYGVDYDEAKSLSFQYLYGYVPPEVIETNQYFSMVNDYIEELWTSYNKEEFIVSDIYNRRIYKKNLSDMNANKLFNYTIQLMETENNMRVLNKLIPKINTFKSKLVLYSYDSFLFDFNMDDGLDYLKLIKDTLEQDGKYPVKVSWGLNYHEMKDITEKFI